VKVHNRPPINPLFVITIGIMAVSTSSVFIRYAQETTSSLVIAAYRMGLATLILAPIATGPGRLNLKEMDKRQLILIIVSGVCLALHFATWISSLAYTTVASSVVLVDTSPLWVAIFTSIFLKDQINRNIFVGLAITLVGSVIIGLSDVCHFSGGGISCPSVVDILGGRGFIGDILALLGAFFASGYLLIGRMLRQKMTLTSYIFLVYGSAAIVLWVIAGVTQQKVTGFPVINYAWFIALAIIPQLIGHSAFNWALRYLSTVFVSLSLLGEPIGSILLAFLLLKEIPSIIEVIGAILVLIGIFLASRVESTSLIIVNNE
jgi:drug/metabolite transporter (DMT)-like permease